MWPSFLYLSQPKCTWRVCSSCEATCAPRNSSCREQTRLSSSTRMFPCIPPAVGTNRLAFPEEKMFSFSTVSLYLFNSSTETNMSYLITPISVLNPNVLDVFPPFSLLCINFFLARLFRHLLRVPFLIRKMMNLSSIRSLIEQRFSK